MKKTTTVFASFALALLMVCVMCAPALAHSGRKHNAHRRNSTAVATQQPQYTPCVLDGCTQVAVHQHEGDDAFYCCSNCHGTSSGVCTLEGCTAPHAHRQNAAHPHHQNQNSSLPAEENDTL